MAAVVKNKQVIFRDYIKTCPKESDMVVRDDIQGISLKVEEGSNAVMFGYGAAGVVDSTHPSFNKGDLVWGTTGWEEYTLSTQPESLFKIQHAHDIPLFLLHWYSRLNC
ncbi:hypothetical protein Ancab_010393 [Ancistrocladus abbreviatus]